MWFNLLIISIIFSDLFAAANSLPKSASQSELEEIYCSYASDSKILSTEEFNQRYGSSNCGRGNLPNLSFVGCKSAIKENNSPFILALSPALQTTKFLNPESVPNQSTIHEIVRAIFTAAEQISFGGDRNAQNSKVTYSSLSESISYCFLKNDNPFGVFYAKNGGICLKGNCYVNSKADCMAVKAACEKYKSNLIVEIKRDKNAGLQIIFTAACFTFSRDSPFTIIGYHPIAAIFNTPCASIIGVAKKITSSGPPARNHYFCSFSGPMGGEKLFTGDLTICAAVSSLEIKEFLPKDR